MVLNYMNFEKGNTIHLYPEATISNFKLDFQTKIIWIRKVVI